MNLKETYNIIANDWYGEVNKNHWWQQGVDKFISYLRKGDWVFDVGCGPGITANTFIKNDVKVFGIDFSEKMIEIAQHQVPLGKFLVMDLAEVDKINNTFDAICMQNVLLHIPKKDVKKTLKSIVGKLKSKGYVYISVNEKKLHGPEEETKVDHDYGYRVERFFCYFTAQEVKKYLTDLGFKIIFFTIVPARNKRWIQVIGKKT